jgi:hypothetical protein
VSGNAHQRRVRRRRAARFDAWFARYKAAWAEAMRPWIEAEFDRERFAFIGADFHIPSREVRS